MWQVNIYLVYHCTTILNAKISRCAASFFRIVSVESKLFSCLPLHQNLNAKILFCRLLAHQCICWISRRYSMSELVIIPVTFMWYQGWSGILWFKYAPAFCIGNLGRQHRGISSNWPWYVVYINTMVLFISFETKVPSYIPCILFINKEKLFW
jgi:hypothetical protein